LPSAACLVAALAWGACTSERQPVVIGLAWPEQPEHTRRVAQALIDSTAPPGERPILVRSFDAESTSPSTALENSVQVALRMADWPGLVAVVGFPSSTETLLAAPIFAEAGVPLLVPTATTRRLADAGGLVFPLAPNDSIEGEFIATFAVERLSARSATLFYTVDDYGTGLAAGVGDALQRRGVIVLDRVPVRLDHNCPPFQDDNPYRVQVEASFLRGVPDVVVVAGRVWETGCIARAVTDLAAATPVIGGDGASAPDSLLVQAAGPAVDHLYAVEFWTRGAERNGSGAFVERFRRVADRDPEPGDAMVHDAIMLAAAAVRGGRATPGAVHGYLRSLGRARGPYPGITGAISFVADARRPLHMRRLRPPAEEGG
jgi:branched-chain amino acid transport system substrate-binding protein